ncbi:SEC-C domain-containing protein [Variovorax sp. LjRoot130]|uniref:YecA family protein n=1 Tax=Variovorax sp. LjRoot130 TaxID=3342261 RepID=UPI003ED10AEF
MTFALVAANADQIIQVSDRRLTGWNGGVLTEAAGKSGHLLCDDASALYCFTGLATIGDQFITSRWLMEALQAASKRNARFRELIEHFSEIATEQFRSNPVVLSAPPEHRRLTVMLTAYAADGFVFNALVSNFQDFINYVDHPTAQPKFTVYCWRSAVPAFSNPTVVQAIGAFSAMTEADEQAMRRLLEKRAPYAAIRQKAVDIVGSISDRHRSAGTVGKRMNTARIDSGAPMAAYSGYESDIVEQGLSVVDMVDGRTLGSGLLVGQIELTSEVPIVFPSVHRNAPCPCGSGKKFRFCHRPRSQ